MYDVLCPQGHQTEMLTAIEDRTAPCRTCGEPTQRIWASRFPSVIGDALDYIDDNICAEPIRITSKSERRRLMKERGLVGDMDAVRHVGTQGSDKSPHTTRWI